MQAHASAAAAMVPLAQAAKVLAEAGDKIDPSNISRYLDRFPEVPAEKRGKFRFVDAVALARHRRENILVADKRQVLDALPANPVRPVDYEPAPRAAEVQNASTELKRLQIREKELDLAEREGSLIPAGDVAALLNATLGAFTRELERQETQLAIKFGRDVVAAVRQGRKAAQAAASAEIVSLAQQLLKDPEAATANTELLAAE